MQLQLPIPEHTLAARILDEWGQTSNDYFKLWPDKEYWFTRSGQGFVAYGVSGHVAVSLGDPIAPPEEMELAIRGWLAFCKQQRWTPLFYQVTPRYLPIYEKLGLQDFKGSEEAIVDLRTFTLQGKDRKAQRNVMNKMQRDGITTAFYDTPVPDEVIDEAREVSDDWLANSNRRERAFTVGRFIDDYVRHTPMMAVRDAEGQMLAFANIIPSYAPDTATIDMMRFKADSPHGVMDYLFMTLFEYNQNEGFHFFSLGPAPIVTPEPGEEASLEEMAFYRLTNYLDSFFSMKGLRVYKAKFASFWEPRYLVYRYRHDLPRFVNAINNLCELDENKKPLLSPQRVRQFRKVSVAIIQETRRRRINRRKARRDNAEKQGLD